MNLKSRYYHPIKNKLAKRYLGLLTQKGCDVIGITGSAGKTTTKELTASVLSMKYKTVSSRANIDPVYNIPATILKAPFSTKKLVLEMGIEYLTDMDFYLTVIKPDVGVLTNIYWTHTQFLGDIERVANEKGKLITGLDEDSYAVLNADDDLIKQIAKKTKAKIVWFSVKNKSDVWAKDIVITEDFKTKFTLVVGTKPIKVELPLLGKHFVPAALAAAAVGKIYGLNLREIKKGLEAVNPQPHRMKPIKLENGALLLDDTYNANPLAAKEALKVLVDVAKDKNKILVLGEMKELGSYEERGHREVGAEIAKSKINFLITVGKATNYTIDEAVKRGLKESSAYLASDKDDLLAKIKSVYKKDDVILIKGSRSLKLEEVVEKL